jgi:AcrR family transcriptional regulator
MSDGTVPRPGRPGAGSTDAITARIVVAATALILDRGAARMTIDEVATAAHASKTTIYARFPTKDDLFDAFTRSHTERHLEALMAWLPADAGRCDEATAVASLVAHVTQEEQVRFLRALIAEGDRRTATVAAAYHRMREGYLAFLTAAAGIPPARGDNLLTTRVARSQLDALVSAPR